MSHQWSKILYWLIFSLSIYLPRLKEEHGMHKFRNCTHYNYFTTPFIIYWILRQFNQYNLTVFSTVWSSPVTGAVTHFPPVVIATEVVYPANCICTGVWKKFNKTPYLVFWMSYCCLLTHSNKHIGKKHYALTYGQ